MQDIRQLDDIEACVDAILAACGDHVVMATPLGLGKPNQLINAVYRRVAADRSRRLTLHTALSLDVPEPASDLERRFAEPFLARQFGADYPRLDYVAAMRADRLPENVRVHEFYFQSGSMLGSRRAQRDYVGLNYTDVARDLVGQGVNLVVQLVARRQSAEAAHYSLGCNPDVTLDLLDRLGEAGEQRPLVVAVVCPELPFLGGDADVGDARGLFDIVLDVPGHRQTLFALPRDDIDDVEYAIGLHASTLIRDGGTLQIGIGALSDALVQALRLRHQRNADYRAILAALDGGSEAASVVSDCGGLDAFSQGLFGSSEMVMDGFMHLRRCGILVREVFDDPALQRALDSGVVQTRLKAGDVAALRANAVLPRRLDPPALDRLAGLGVVAAGFRLEGDSIRLPDGERIANDLDAPDVQSRLERHVDGRRLRGGRYLQGGFCLGSVELYRWLSALEGEDFDGLDMCRISRVNRLQRGAEILAAQQRRAARFFNTCMIATCLGAAASDALEDGRLVSGVGGQFNFVAMAKELDDARSILLLRATRRDGGSLQSNIRWNYGHTTIPRHLRDIYITEYGIADLRGRTDEQCVMAMLAICDARFHEELVREAIAARKLPVDFCIPDAWKRNTRQHLGERLRPGRQAGLLVDYPFGSDFSEVEQRLLKALGWLKANLGQPRRWPALIRAFAAPGKGDAEASQRMGFASPRGIREHLSARLLKAALSRTGARRPMP